MTCEQCLCLIPCSPSMLNDMYENNAENCPYFKNKADFVEVVRCRDCMSCEIVIDQFDNDWYFCKKTKDNAEVKADHFCGYGEKEIKERF